MQLIFIERHNLPHLNGFTLAFELIEPSIPATITFLFLRILERNGYWSASGLSPNHVSYQKLDRA
jgi:hypothetical protein